MKLRKNLTAKIAAVAASLIALGVTLGLVQRNPPPSASATTQAPVTDSAPAASAPAENFDGGAQPPASAPAPTTRTHTRTHVS